MLFDYVAEEVKLDRAEIKPTGEYQLFKLKWQFQSVTFRLGTDTDHISKSHRSDFDQHRSYMSGVTAALSVILVGSNLCSQRAQFIGETVYEQWISL